VPGPQVGLVLLDAVIFGDLLRMADALEDAHVLATRHNQRPVQRGVYGHDLLHEVILFRTAGELLRPGLHEVTP